jgi:F0F1-type ATP synthase membrane subunit a
MSSSTVVDGKPRKLVFAASYVAVVHTVFASTAFTLALFLACLLHYKKVVRNGVAQWPDEWWPSVSATYISCLFAPWMIKLNGMASAQNWGLVS